MVFLEKLILPDSEQEYRLAQRRRAENGGPFGYLENGYPCMLFPERGLRELDFEAVTILAGGNGSGKSTLLHVLAEKLSLARQAPHNGGELSAPYAAACCVRFGLDEEGEPLSLPEGSRLIASDDVFEYMLAARGSNERVAADTERAREEYAALKYGETVRFTGLEDYEAVRAQLLARQRSRRRFAHAAAGREVRLRSNGETALRFFEHALKEGRLYLLDEPENSLSPAMQRKLKGLLEEMARYGGCQFVIATHSPFLLALRGGKLYDLDACPVTVRPWWELEGPRAYFEFFEENRGRFCPRR